MYLHSLTMKDFRSFSNGTVYFADDVTVLTGANNSGKSTVLDALRHILSPADDRQRPFLKPEDVRDGCSSLRIEVAFADLTEDQKGLLITAIGDLREGMARFGFRWAPPVEKNSRFVRPERWAGPREGADPEPEARQWIRYVYLPALRDAHLTLASGRPDQIQFLLRHFSDEEHGVDDLENAAREALSKLGDHALIRRTSEQISSGLGEITQGVQRHGATLGFAQPELRSLARDLRFRLRQEGFEAGDVARSGLGIANLLYIACVLVELAAAKDTHLTILLMEEPEAHLHPQLQALLLGYLRDKAKESRARASVMGEPEGRIQVVVATHSPNLAASVPIESIVVLRGGSGFQQAPVLSETERLNNCVPAPANVSVPVAQLGLDRLSSRKIARYLDVTKSALLFSSRALLVEGISEALLLPALAEKLLGRTEPEALARFRGATLVPIAGVDFEPYIRLLLTEFGEVRIADRVVVLTDDDDDGDRGRRLRDLAVKLGADSALEVVLVPGTLEAAIYDAGNEDLLLKVLRILRPRLDEQEFADRVRSRPAPDRGKAYASFISEKRVRKGDHAQCLAELMMGDDMRIPEALESAIRAIACGGSR